MYNNPNGRNPRSDEHAASAPSAEQVRRRLSARGLLVGVRRTLASKYCTLDVAFGRDDAGKLDAHKNVARARRAALAWLYLDSGAGLSSVEVARLCGVDHSCVLDAAKRAKAERERRAA